MNPNQIPPPLNTHPPASESNTPALLGLIFAFVFAPAGLIISIIGLKKAKQLNGEGRDLALAGVIVSSIATAIFVIGLIISIILIAVPTFRQYNRDEQRQTDIDAVKVQLDNYINGNSGNLPTQGAEGTFANEVLSATELNFYKPDFAEIATSHTEDKEPEHILYVEQGQPTNATYYPNPDSFHVWGGSKCGAETLGDGETYTTDDIKSAGSGAWVIVYAFEKDQQVYCSDGS